MKFVTLDEAKYQLNIAIDDADHDDILDIYIEAASEAVADYLQDAVYEFMDSNGEVIEDSDGAELTPKKVKTAVLMLVGLFFRDRDVADSAAWRPGFLPAPVISLLYSMRVPGCA